MSTSIVASFITVHTILSLSPPCVDCAEHHVLEVCQGSAIRLACTRGRVIELESLALADSRCLGFSSCCPRRSDCKAAPSEAHARLAHSECDGRSSCSLVTERRRIPCGIAGFPVNNDYERITYWCKGEIVTFSGADSIGHGSTCPHLYKWLGTRGAP